MIPQVKTQTKLTKEEAQRELWMRGSLSWKLDSTQKELYQLYYNTNHKVQTWLLSRRSGKSYSLCILALEQCIRHPRSIVKFVSPTKLQVTNNIRPLLYTILQDCPEEIKPEFKAKDYIYYFPNGSELQLAGTDSGHAEKLRGGDSHIAIVDEAGSCDNLDNIVKSILLPTTLITRGKVILASTPPEESDHDFIKFIEDAEMRGSLIKKTIYDNPRITKEQIQELVDELGGEKSEAFQRECLCAIVKDPKSSVIPEFTPEIEKIIIREWPQPPFFDTYEAMDIGFKDMTVVLFGYYDFRADKIIVEDEYCVKGNEISVDRICAKISEKEEALWKNSLTHETKTPYIRVSDINYIVMKEIYDASKGKINFIATKKDDKTAAINTVRTLINHKKIIIHPRCETLIRHLRNVKWASRTSGQLTFARSPDDSHYDAVDALIYLVRNIVFGRNPYPAHYDLNLRVEDSFIRNPKKYNATQNSDVYRTIFNIKKR